MLDAATAPPSNVDAAKPTRNESLPKRSLHPDPVLPSMLFQKRVGQTKIYAASPLNIVKGTGADGVAAAEVSTPERKRDVLRTRQDSLGTPKLKY